MRDPKIAEAWNTDTMESSELAFAGLAAYIEEVLEEDEPSLLTLTDLVKLYPSRLERVWKSECNMAEGEDPRSVSISYHSQ